MDYFSKKSDSSKKSEIMKMTVKIIERYDVFNFSIANRVAIRLYENGIKSDKFHENYYKGKFNLDEIVLYLLKIQVREEKTIVYQEYVSSKEKHRNSEAINNEKVTQNKQPAKILSYFPYKYDPKVKKHSHKEWLYYYNKNIK